MYSLLALGLLPWLMSPIACRSLSGKSATSDIYHYMKARDAVMHSTKAQFPVADMKLSQDEIVVDRYLRYLKFKEFERTRMHLPVLRPLGEELETIKSSDIYRVLRTFPKGGILHTHEANQIPVRLFFEIVWNSSDFEHLYVLHSDPTKTPWRLDFFITPPADQPWVRLADSTYTMEDILHGNTLLNVLSPEALKYPSDTHLRFVDALQLWIFSVSNLITNINIRADLLRALYKTSLVENVQYLETRYSLDSLTSLYQLNSSDTFNETNGKEYLDRTGEMDISFTEDTLKYFKEKHPEFIGHRRIINTRRSIPKASTQIAITRIAALHEKYPEHIVGLDIVSHENAGYSLLYNVESFLQNDTLKRLPLYLHAGETNIPIDIMMSERDDDLSPTAENCIDAILLGAKRIGHGTPLFKYPYLLELIKQKEIVIEVNPISSKTLGLVPDLNSHPIVNYLHSGVRVVLGSDDAGDYGHDEFTVDWYMAFMAWELTLASMHQLAINSLQYSSMSKAQSKAAINDQWMPRWQTFIANTKAQACSQIFISTPSYIDIYPRIGSTSEGTHVHLYGRHFEVGICKNITCSFGDELALSVEFVSTRHLVCEAPVLPEGSYEVNVALDGGVLIHTGIHFSSQID